jgi:hypothetical protein
VWPDLHTDTAPPCRFCAFTPFMQRRYLRRAPQGRLKFLLVCSPFCQNGNVDLTTLCCALKFVFYICRLKSAQVSSKGNGETKFPDRCVFHVNESDMKQQVVRLWLFSFVVT